MSNFMRIFLILIFFFLFGNVFAQKKAGKKNVVTVVQNDPEAEKWLKNINVRYGSLSSYRFSYSATILIPDAKKNETFNGQYTVQGNRFSITINKMDVKSDGITNYNINHETKEIQINPVSGKDRIETPFDFIKKYKTLFKYRVKETLSNSQVVVELIPLQKNSNIFKIDLTINSATSTLISAKAYEKSGVRVNYTIVSKEEGKSYPEATFTVNTANYKGYEILDMR